MLGNLKSDSFGSFSPLLGVPVRSHPLPAQGCMMYVMGYVGCTLRRENVVRVLSLLEGFAWSCAM